MNKTETKTKFNTVNSIADDFQILQRFQEFGSLNPTQKVREQLRKMLLCFRFKWFFSCSLESKQTNKQRVRSKVLIESFRLTHILTPPQPIRIIFCQYHSRSTDQRLYCTFGAIPVMQGLGTKKERLVFKGATAVSVSSAYQSITSSATTPVPDKPHL